MTRVEPLLVRRKFLEAANISDCHSGSNYLGLLLETLAGRNGGFPNRIKANSMIPNLVSNNMKMNMSFTQHKKIVFENVLIVKSIHHSKDSLEQVKKLQIKLREFDFLTGYSVLFYCYIKFLHFRFLLLCYLVRDR